MQPELGDAFQKIISWADETRIIGRCANTDTPQDACLSRDFNVDGIGLVRPEHMFFKSGHLHVMREKIFTNTDNDSQAVLDLLVSVQRSDFIELFETKYLQYCN